MDSDGNNNPHKKQFKRTPTLSAEAIHGGIKSPSVEDKAEAEAINALAEEVVLMSRENLNSENNSEQAPESSDGDRINLAPISDNPPSYSPIPVPDISPSADAARELYPEPSTPTFGPSNDFPSELTSAGYVEPTGSAASDDSFSSLGTSSPETPEVSEAPAFTSDLIDSAEPSSISSSAEEIISEPFSAAESTDATLAPEPAPEMNSDNSNIEFASEPLSDADTVVAPEPLIASDTPVSPASTSPEPVAVNFSASQPSLPVSPAPVPEAPATSPVIPPSPSDASVSQGIVNTPQKKSSSALTTLIIIFMLILLAGLGFLAYIIVVEPKTNNKNLEVTATPSAAASVDQSLVCILPSNSTKSPDESYTSAFQQIALNYHDSALQDLFVEQSYAYNTYDAANKKKDALKSSYSSALTDISLTIDPFYSSFTVDPPSQASDSNTTYSAIESHYLTADELTAKNSTLIGFPLPSSSSFATDLETVKSAYSNQKYSCKTDNKLLTLIPEAETDKTNNSTNKK
ncbi:MAG: hypothetical protein Q4F60_01600 [Candidatus Saccharibacteria bacterium]|nr:hypothetical protein [Candidatus Saccharibacteria bacterium]